MSIKVFTEGNTLRVLDSSDDIPQGREMELFTGEEIEKLVAQKIWQSIPKESREDMMFQTQSRSYQDWMAQDEWDSAWENLSSSSSLQLSDFKA